MNAKPESRSGSASPPGAAPRRKMQVDADGVIHIDAFELPISAALSPEARQAQINALLHSELGLAPFADVTSEAEFIAEVDKARRQLDEKFLGPLAGALLAAFPVAIAPGEIAGVPVEVFTPAAEADPDRILINLHGGAYFCGAIHGGRVEAIPVANLARIKVVSVDYRQGYEHKHPAATEDVVAVYRELLKSHSPQNIGIYGGSAGGRLTAQVVARLIHEGVPPPAAAGVFGSGAGGVGDAAYFGKIGMGEPPPPASAPEEIFPVQMRSEAFGYFAGVAVNDPWAAPLHAPPEVLAKFPPTLFITATRAFDMSQATLFHRALSRAGAEAHLHVYDGLGHCFYYNAWLPESKEAYDTIVRFFDRCLGDTVSHPLPHRPA